MYCSQYWWRYLWMAVHSSPRIDQNMSLKLPPIRYVLSPPIRYLEFYRIPVSSNYIPWILTNSCLLQLDTLNYIDVLSPPIRYLEFYQSPVSSNQKPWILQKSCLFLIRYLEFYRSPVSSNQITWILSKSFSFNQIPWIWSEVWEVLSPPIRNLKFYQSPVSTDQIPWILMIATLTALYLCTVWHKIYRKSVLYLLEYRFAVYLSRCSTDLR